MAPQSPNQKLTTNMALLLVVPHWKKLDLVHNEKLQICMGAFRTSPVVPLQIEIWFPPNVYDTCCDWETLPTIRKNWMFLTTNKTQNKDEKFLPQLDSGADPKKIGFWSRLYQIQLLLLNLIDIYQKGVAYYFQVLWVSTTKEWIIKIPYWIEDILGK